MTILDANVLLYAYNADALQHRATTQWLKKLFESGETIALPWISIWAFVRIGTNPRISMLPMSAREAFTIVAEWLDQPGIVLLNPGPLHAQILERLVRDFSATGPMVTDAALAALAIEYGASLASADQDFRRFPELRWTDPLGR